MSPPFALGLKGDGENTLARLENPLAPGSWAGLSIHIE